MALSSVLCLFFVLSVLPANSQHLEIQKITVLEGEPAILNCTINGSESAVIEWKNPRGYVIFFTNMRGLKDTRYKLVNFSNTMLIVSLLNTTVEDGGTYTCLQYGYAIETKQVLLRVLAPPNRPTLSMTKHELHGEEKKVFTCITTGSKPKPQITWLLNNEVRLQVHTTYELENNGLKFTTTSTLKIIEHYNELRIDCLVEHEGLTNTLRATLQFGSKSRKIQIIVPTNSSEKDESITSDTSSSTDYNPLRSTESYTHTNEIRPESMTENSTQNAFTTTHSFFTSTEDPQILTNESETSMNSNSTTDEESPVTVSGQSTLQTKADLHTSFYSNSTESNSTEQHEEKSENRSNQTNQMKHSTALILILIAFLICALFIIIQLFVLKVRKEHMKWKKQNDDSEQTVESNRSNKSSNEDNFRHESNNREQNLVTQYAVRINSVEHLEQQHSNGIHEDHLNKTEKESDV